MRTSRHKILFTRKLTADQLAIFKQAGLMVEAQPFIETESIDGYKLKLDQLSLNASSNIVVTSPFAVSLLVNYLQGNEITLDTIFCLSKSSANLLSSYARETVVAEEANALALAEKIKQHKSLHTLIFISGEIRRDVLPEMLSAAGIVFSEVCIYTTKLCPKAGLDGYSAVVFFSPSAVRSYKKLYSLQNKKLYAIGNTTKQEILKTDPDLKVAVPVESSFESIASLVIFTQSKD